MIIDYENMHDISRFYQQIGWNQKDWKIRKLTLFAE
jgi:hypothetical protein